MKGIKVLLLTGLLFICCVGCAGAPDALSEVQPEQAPDNTVTLRLFAWQDEGADLALLTEAYKKLHPEIKFDIRLTNITEYTQLMMAVKDGTKQGDAVFFPNPAEACVWQNKGVLRDITAELQALNYEEHYDDWCPQDALGCKNVMLPYRMSRWAVYYNKKIFDAAGVPYPDGDWTWETYAQTAQQVTGRFNGKLCYGSMSFNPDSSWWRIPARTEGANNPFDESQLSAFRRALEWNYHLTYDLKVQAPYSERTGNSGFNYSATFLEGTTAMLIGGDWNIKIMNDAIAAQGLDFDYDLAPMPHWEGKKSWVIRDPSVMAILDKTEHPAETLSFMQFVCGEAGAQVLAANSVLPAWNTPELQTLFQQSVKVPAHVANLYQEGEVSGVPAAVQYTAAMEDISSEAAMYLLQEQTIDQTFANIQAHLKALG